MNDYDNRRGRAYFEVLHCRRTIKLFCVGQILLPPATLLKVKLLHGSFLRSLNCIDGSESRKLSPKSLAINSIHFPTHSQLLIQHHRKSFATAKFQYSLCRKIVTLRILLLLRVKATSAFQ